MKFRSSGIVPSGGNETEVSGIEDHTLKSGDKWTFFLYNRFFMSDNFIY